MPDSKSLQNHLTLHDFLNNVKVKDKSSKSWNYISVDRVVGLYHNLGGHKTQSGLFQGEHFSCLGVAIHSNMFNIITSDVLANCL